MTVAEAKKKVAAAKIHQCLERLTGMKLSPLRNVASTEWFGESQYELLMSPHAPDCLYTDICDFYNPRVLQELQSMMNHGVSLNLEIMRPVIMSGKAARTSAPCKRHNKQCRHGRAIQHWVGTPCIDFSLMGDQKGEEGKTMLHFDIWAALRRLVQEPLIVHEECTPVSKGCARVHLRRSLRNRRSPP